MSIDSVSGYSSYNTSNTSTIQTERKVIEADKNLSSGAVYQSEMVIMDSQNKENTDSVSGIENSENHLKSVLSVANQKIRPTNTRCEFEYHEKTKRVSIKVIDENTKEIVREIPPEETLEMVEKLWELAGLFLDEKR